jgi:hypothetical protein
MFSCVDAVAAIVLRAGEENHNNNSARPSALGLQKSHPTDTKTVLFVGGGSALGPD